MKKVTNKTAWNIYSNATQKTIDEALKPYTNKQIVKIIDGIKNRTQWEAEYLEGIILSKIQSRLREIKLTKIGI